MEKPTFPDLPVDNSSEAWGSPRSALIALACLAAVAALASAGIGRAGDGPGAVLLGVLAAVLAALALYGSAVRPRLSAGADGVRVRTLAGTLAAPWQRTRIALPRTRRLGREVETLELELLRDPAESDPTLVVLGRFELGADPIDVFDRLCALRDGARPPG